MILNYDSQIGIFLRRPNRFIAHIELNSTEVICHVPNTGRLRELLIPGVPVLISHHPSDTRKTQYELRMVIKDGNWISIDSQLPNTLAKEAIANDVIQELAGYNEIRREVVYENSRFDLQLRGDSTPCFVEVKGVTLEREGWSYFPDAPTERGRKHIDELIHAVHHGYRGVLLFVVQIEDAKGFSPNKITDPGFAEKVNAAHDAGVELLAYRCHVSPEEVRIIDRIPIIL